MINFFQKYRQHLRKPQLLFNLINDQHFDKINSQKLINFQML